MISKEEIEAVIGDVAEVSAAAAGLPHAAPGMHRKHYSPRTPLLLIAPGERPVGGRGAVVSHRSHAHGVVRMSADPKRYAAALYATLHELDGQGYDWIAVERVPELDAWAGIRDRLTRAAAHE
jgi:L-threonylcarbamoyladenylate synthase